MYFYYWVETFVGGLLVVPHPTSSNCFNTNMVYKICLLLKSTLKTKSKIYDTVGTITKTSREIVETEAKSIYSNTIIIKHKGSPPPGIGDLSRFWLYYIGSLVSFPSKTFTLFLLGFPIISL